MKIIIAGGGAVGFHLAELLAKENQDITLIDNDEEVLNHASTHLDVMTIKGDSSSIAVLQQAEVAKANLFLAVTTAENTNLLSAILARQLGAKKTIARVNNPEYLEKAQIENFQKLGVDWLISPELSAAREIELLLRRSSFTDIYEFEEGKISVVGITLDFNSPLIGKTVRTIDELNPDFPFTGVAILRDHQTIIPRGDTVLRKADHLYLAVQNQCIDRATTFVGKQLKNVKRIMIIGGTELALRTAQLLENKYAISLVLDDKEIGKKFLSSLQDTLVIVADTSNIDLLKEEGLETMDAFIALTPNSEINIITSLMAEEVGVYKTIAMVDNVNYTHISQNIGIDTIINKKLIAANEIFRFVRKGKIEAIVNLHGVDAEVIEFSIHRENRLVKRPICELYMPEKAVIAGVIRGKESIIPDGDFTFQLDDKAIVFTLPEAIARVEQLFK